MRTIAIVNQKGGCGKTTTSINLSAFLALAGRRVLLVDMDPQGHSTLGLTPGGLPDARTMYDVLLSETGRSYTTIQDITRPVGENLDLAPADIRLSAIPETLAGVAERENVLARAFADLTGHYDYIIVDCPPNVGLLTFNALKGCTEALIPMDPSFFSLHGIGKLFETFELLERETGHRISARVLITLYSGRTTFVKAVVEEVHRHLAGEHYATAIRHSVKLAEAASHGLPITRYSKRCAGFEDYQALADEILRQEVKTAIPEEVVTAAGPVLTADGVLFTVEAPGAVSVQLAGDFNDWTPHGSEMEQVGDVWKKTLLLAPGRYRYRYVVDGQWRRDPHNQAVEPSPFGGDDSLLVLDGTETADWLVPQAEDHAQPDPDRPLGRGLEDVSHVFLSPKGEESAGEQPVVERRMDRPLPREKTPPSPLLLRPSAIVTREHVAAALKEFEGGLEAGLRGLDTAIPCAPNDEIDLLAIDRASQLTIVDFDTTTNDDLLIRGLAHFDWALGNVPNLRRMFRGQPINFSLEPRLILLAPQFSPRIMSAARQLTRPRISWVRYHFVETPGRAGILFEPLSQQ